MSKNIKGKVLALMLAGVVTMSSVGAYAANVKYYQNGGYSKIDYIYKTSKIVSSNKSTHTVQHIYQKVEYDYDKNGNFMHQVILGDVEGNIETKEHSPEANGRCKCGRIFWGKTIGWVWDGTKDVAGAIIGGVIGSKIK